MKNMILDEAVIKEQAMTRKDRADRLIEHYAQKRQDIVGKRWLDSASKNINAIRRTAMALDNMEKSLRNMNEATISNAFPIPLQNLLRVIRLSYPNMIFPEIFSAYQMNGWHDAIYYIDTVTGLTKRGATVGDKTYESALSRYTTEVEFAQIDATGANTNYKGTIGSVVAPLRPYKVVLYIENQPVAVDNGEGVFVNAYGSTLLSAVTPSTIVYSSGVYDITFTDAPGKVISVEYNFDSEVEDNFDEIANVDIRVRDYQFRPTPDYIGVTWSHMAEFKMKYTLNQDVDDILNSASVDLIRQNQDIRSLRFGYGLASKQTRVNWDANFIASNTYTLKDHLDTFTYAVDRLSAEIYNTLNRGVINKMYGTSKTIAILKQHRNFVADGSMLQIGCFKAGTINGIDLYQVPDAVFTNTADSLSVNDLVCVFKDEQEEGHHSVVFGEIVPITSTMQLEFGSAEMGFQKQNGLYRIGDKVVTEPRFVRCIRMLNIPDV